MTARLWMPRKFNIAFDGGGRVPVLGHQRHRLRRLSGYRRRRLRGAFRPIWQLGGITGHLDFAARRRRDRLAPADACGSRCAVRVFIANGDRTDRQRAQCDARPAGADVFLAEVEGRPPPLRRAAGAASAPRPSADRLTAIRRARPEAAWPKLYRPGAAGRPDHHRPDAWSRGVARASAAARCA